MSNRRETYANGKYGTDFVHAVAVRVLTDVVKSRPGRQFVTEFLHYVIGELFHAFRSSPHAHELQIIANLTFDRVYSLIIQTIAVTTVLFEAIA